MATAYVWPVIPQNFLTDLIGAYFHMDNKMRYVDSKATSLPNFKWLLELLK